MIYCHKNKIFLLLLIFITCSCQDNRKYSKSDTDSSDTGSDIEEMDSNESDFEIIPNDDLNNISDINNDDSTDSSSNNCFVPEPDNGLACPEHCLGYIYGSREENCNKSCTCSQVSDGYIWICGYDC